MDAHGQWRTVDFAYAGNLETIPGEWACYATRLFRIRRCRRTRRVGAAYFSTVSAQVKRERVQQAVDEMDTARSAF